MRDDRARFLAAGGPALVNVLVLLLIAFSASFRPGSRLSMNFALALGALCLLQLIAAAVRRGRDLGWNPVLTALACLIGLPLMPLNLILLGVLAVLPGIPGDNPPGPPRPPAGSGELRRIALLNLLWPWLLMVPALLAHPG